MDRQKLVKMLWDKSISVTDHESTNDTVYIIEENVLLEIIAQETKKAEVRSNDKLKIELLKTLLDKIGYEEFVRISEVKEWAEAQLKVLLQESEGEG